MNSVDITRPSGPLAAELQHEYRYRSISRAAVACLVFAVLALLSFVGSVFVLLALLGTGFGVVALVNLRRFEDELVGLGTAKLGLAVNLICLVSGVAMHSYIYATEVPEGYSRISYGALAPNRQLSLPYSKQAEEFDGQKVFIKGYVRPSDRKTKLKNFILVGDFGSCCFGGNPKITDVVAVSIVIDETVNYGYGLRRIGGTFRLNRRPRPIGEQGVPQVYYEIEADYLR